MTSKPTGDLALIKKMNTSIVLDAVVKFAPLSRAQIAERTGLNKATVSSLIQDLINSNLVIEIGTGKSSGGRKPVMLLFNGAAGYAIGIDLGVNYLRGVLVDLDGNVIFEHHTDLSESDSNDASFALEQLAACIELLISHAPDSAYGIVGIGIGIPGIVDDQGHILFAPNLSWRDVELRKPLEERFGILVTIDNEANAGALGEQTYGAGRGIANQIYISAGIGIGTGIILNKELYKGTGGFSGELGHLSIEYDGKLCNCGNRGCWELYASEKSLLEQAAMLGINSLDSSLHAAGQGDERVISLFTSIGQYLGAGIASIANIFNPEAIIMGNRMSRAAEWLEPAILTAVNERALPYHRERLRIIFAELQEQSAVRGAACYAINNFFIKFNS